ncbi:MAG TPA: ATP-binding protein [Blastocatellia bacterium]|nr:ATP-binding protein [Blastocatellia bacterium]
MRSKSVLRQFFLLLALAFLLVLVFTIQMLREFSRLSTETARLTRNLEETHALNDELHDRINDQIHLLYKQLHQPDPLFPQKLSQTLRELSEKQARYLQLEIGDEERLGVERIQTLHAELGAQALQIYEQLRGGNRRQAVLRLQELDRLQEAADQAYQELSRLQTQKLRDVQGQLDSSVKMAYLTIYGLAGSLLVFLAVFILLLHRRVVQPLGSILEASERIRQGDFSARAPVIYDDEIGRLAQGFNFMAGALAGMYADLESKVEERTRQLKDLQQQLVQVEKMSAIGNLVSGIAHELNNPLTVIMGYTELALRRLKGTAADPKEVKFLEDILAEAERCRRIVAKLLQFARPETPERRSVHINELIEQAVQLRSYEMQVSGIEVVREYDPSDPVIDADAHKLQQVILNLLDNAYDAIREAGRPGKIWLRTKAAEGKLTIEVLDNGTGISEPARVFDPFYTTKEVGQGTGLGLSISYGIIEEHHGTIRAENWAEGARFTIILPAAPAD